MTVAAIILAAGQSKRFANGNKLLASVDGVPLLRRVLNEVEKAPVSGIVVVVAPGASDVIRAAGDGTWRVTVAADAAQGLSASLRAGIGALPPEADGALVVLGDMPDVEHTLIARLIAGFRADGQRRITCPVDKDGRRGNPVLWPKAYFARLSALTGDVGGKALIETNAANVLAVHVDGEAAFTDIDTQDDLSMHQKKPR